MSFIRATGTAVPKNKHSPEEIKAAAAVWLKAQPEQRMLFERFVGSSGINNRHFILPAIELLKLNGMRNRAKLFEENASILGCAAIEQALKASKLEAKDIDAMIYTSCTCPTIPAIDTAMIAEIGLRHDILRIPLYQHGCAGGVIGLSLAHRLSQNGLKVLISSVELCSLVFYANDIAIGDLVGSVIFGDGAGSVIVSNDEIAGLCIKDTQSLLLPNTRDLMGYDIKDDGPHLRLDKTLPIRLEQILPAVVTDFLQRNELNLNHIHWWLIHPGGAKILNLLQETFVLSDEQAGWARKILSRCGNMSSATILFVLDDFIKTAPYRKGDYALMVGVGPGLTIELILFQILK